MIGVVGLTWADGRHRRGELGQAALIASNRWSSYDPGTDNDNDVDDNDDDNDVDVDDDDDDDDDSGLGVTKV